MPKEVIRESDEAFIDVRWGPENFNVCQVYVDRGDEFKFLNEAEETETIHTGLAVTLYSVDDVNRLIKALQRAKRSQAFKGSL